VLINSIDATYTAFLIPVIVAFIGRAGDDTRKVTALVEIVFGCFFLVDILLNIHVGFVLHYDYKKKVVMNGKHILWYYIKYGGAWIDLLSIIPLFYELYSLIFLGLGADQSDSVAVLRMFRLLRIYRILKRIYGSSFAGSTITICYGIKVPSAAVYMLSVVYSMLVMMNFLGCLLFYLAHLENEDLDGTWVFKYIQATNSIPDDVDPDEHVLGLINNHTQAELYITSLYWAVTTVTTVGYGDITPNSFTEMIVMIVVMLSHIMLFGLLIGSISEMVKSSLKSVQFQEERKRKTESIGKWMKFRRLPQPIVRKINSYYTEIQRYSKDFDEIEILDELPLTLRTEVIYRVTKNLMGQLKVFEGIEPATMKKVAGRLIPVTMPPGRQLVRQGDEAEALFILEDGQMDVLFEEATLYSIDGPETCAETGVLSNFIPQLTHHPVTLRTFTACTLWKLHSKDLAPVFAMDARLRDALIEGYRQRLLKSFGPYSGGIERKVESEFGCKLSNILARQFRATLEKTQVKDGTFRKLIEDVVSGRFAAQGSSRLTKGFRFETTGEDTSSNTARMSTTIATMDGKERTEEERQGLIELVDRIKQAGEFGMINLVSHLKRKAGDSGRLDFDGLRDVSNSLVCPLRPRLLLLLFSLFDPMETEFVNIYSIIDELRGLMDFTTREKHIIRLFNRLDYQEKYEEERGDGILSIAELMRRFRVENHPDVISGVHSTSVALNQFVTALGHEDITLKIFTNFHRDLGLCVEEDSRFFRLTTSLWTMQTQDSEET